MLSVSVIPPIRCSGALLGFCFQDSWPIFPSPFWLKHFPAVYRFGAFLNKALIAQADAADVAIDTAMTNIRSAMMTDALASAPPSIHSSALEIPATLTPLLRSSRKRISS